MLRPGKGESGLYTYCSAARISDTAPTGGATVKRRFVAFSIAFGFATNKIIPDDSKYLHTQRRTQDYLELTQNSDAVRRLSVKRLGRGGTLGRTTRRSLFLGLMWKPFFRAHASADDHNPTTKPHKATIDRRSMLSLTSPTLE